MKLSEAIELFLHEDEGIPKALLAERRNIERVIGAITRAFQQGGRLFYVGAGTSGRLGILDASECPPTFRSDPEQVQGIIAGGAEAAFRSIEGAEDDLLAGAEALRFRGAGRRDVIVGIAASGRTPFVLGALDHARQIADIIIAPDLGPELLTGSTRLKSGTATKLILNLFTTLAMVRIGKVMSNLMVDLNPSNSKLRARALRIVQTLAMCSIEEAGTALKKSGWKVREAVSSLQKRKTPGLSTGG
jgi:N-acetylmuramic acid 6-phosphate etherase